MAMTVLAPIFLAISAVGHVKVYTGSQTGSDVRKVWWVSSSRDGEETNPGLISALIWLILASFIDSDALNRRTTKAPPFASMWLFCCPKIVLGTVLWCESAQRKEDCTVWAQKSDHRCANDKKSAKKKKSLMFKTTYCWSLFGPTKQGSSQKAGLWWEWHHIKDDDPDSPESRALWRILWFLFWRRIEFCLHTSMFRPLEYTVMSAILVWPQAVMADIWWSADKTYPSSLYTALLPSHPRMILSSKMISGCTGDKADCSQTPSMRF